MGQTIARTKDWEQFKQKLGNGDFEAGVQAIEAAVTAMKEQYGSELLSVVLFGSLARGSKRYDDIDLLIVTANEMGPASQATQSLAKGIFGPLFLDYGQLFSFLLYSRAQLEGLRDLSPLFDEIAREGIVLYGQNPFVETTSSGIPADHSSPVGDG